MPIYIVSLNTCDCTPAPDFAFRADDMISAVMQCQEKLEMLNRKATESGVDMHDDIKIASIHEADFELMDEIGIQDVVDFWKECVAK